MFKEFMMYQNQIDIAHGMLGINVRKDCNYSEYLDHCIMNMSVRENCNYGEYLDHYYGDGPETDEDD